MPTSERNGTHHLTPAARAELGELIDAFRRSAPKASRRDLLRWSAIAAGAVATARAGGALAGPAGATSRLSRWQDQEVEPDATVTIPLDPYGQPVTLDPHRTVNWGPFWVMFPNVWGGLVRYDELGKVQLDLAESYTVSEDGKVYQFKIRPDAKFANGKTVTANDFVASWKRALDPSRPSPMAGFMEQVKGFREYLSRESEDLGFEAVDDSTVEITLIRPYSYFLSYLASFVWSVVDPEVVAEKGDEEFVLNDAGTGPWRITEFDPAAQIVMEPNANYYGGTSPSIVKIVWSLLSGPTAASEALNRYKQDEVVSADVPLSLKSAVERDPDLSRELVKISPEGSVRALAMDFKQAPFNDVRVRRAFMMATDRDRWANEIWEGTWTPATSFTPPVVETISGYEAPEMADFNADEAKGLMEDAGFPNGEGFPELTFYEPESDTDDEKARWRTYLDSLQDVLGVTIQHDTSKTVDQIESVRSDNGGLQLASVWWWNLAETPFLLSEVFDPGSFYMKGWFNWSEEIEPAGDFDPGADATAFRDLVKKADVELDAATRNDLYKQAEELVLKNAVAIPLGYWIQMYVQKPWLAGTRQGPWTGRLPVLFDKDVVVLKR